ncbi:hypothetical protein LCGC14_1268510 [marine sediment metagenome]|uniref:Phage Gp37/Gp68 family protein n=1 Tax=marine sediment metagenome TaxID=412755 RepID=A0A0F9KYT9_9ZZZZ
MATSKIPWTDVTWNVCTGCSKVSAGCANCYAATMTKRLKAMGQVKYAAGFDTVVCHPDELNKPLRWKKPRRVFVNSMSDLFHEDVPFRFINLVFITMAYARQHTFQVLTKRPHRIAPFLEYAEREGYARTLPLDLCLPNVWLGTSIENQATANLRIPHLRRCPAAVRFLSLEPLLGSVEIGLNSATCDCCPRWASRWVRLNRPVGPDIPRLLGESARDYVADAGVYLAQSNRHGALSVQTPKGLLGIKPDEFEALPAPDWVIVGGESGPGARPMKPDWVRSIRNQCAAAGVPFFFKGWGDWAPEEALTSAITPARGFHPNCVVDGVRVYRVGKKKAGNLLDGERHEQWPEDLRVQQWPKGA